MKIVYVHHGNRQIGNPPNQDDDLSPIGYRDCELTAELLAPAKEQIKAIYTSPFFRCKKTAEILNKNLGVPIVVDDRLDEFRSVEGETWTDLQNRVTACIEEILAKYDDEDMVICVTSGVNIVSFINKAYNLPSSENAPFLGVPNCCPIIFDYHK